MSSRKMKKSFPLSEFSVLFSENINSVLKSDVGEISLFDIYPNNEELYNIAKIVGNTLRVIVYQEADDCVYVIDKNKFIELIKCLSCDALRVFKRTGFKASMLENVKIEKQNLNDNSLVFVTESIFYRMVIDSSALKLLKKYVEKNRFHQIKEDRKDQTVMRGVFQNKEDVSILKLKVLMWAISNELRSIKN